MKLWRIIILLELITTMAISLFILNKYSRPDLISPCYEYGCKLGDPIKIPILTPTPTQVSQNQALTGLASYYSREGCLGCSSTLTMANGEPLDDNKLTVAYNDVPLNSYITVQNIKNGKSVTARVTDTGGFKRHGKIIDLTIATRDAIGCGHVCEVKIIK